MSATPPPSSLRRGLAAAALAAAPWTPALAQIVPTGSPAADIVLFQAISEHRIFLTCSALDPASHAQVLANWQRDTAAAVRILAGNGVPADAIAAFTAAAAPERLMPADDTPFAEVRQLCDANPDWQTSYFALNLTVLKTRLPQVLE